MHFLHVGYPKCASAFLQRRYFLEQNGFRNLIRNGAWRQYLINEVLAEQTLTYEGTAHPVPEVPDSPDPNGMLSGISYEGIVDSPLMFADISLIVPRLARVFPNAAALVIVRRQEDILYSYYCQMIKEGMALPYEAFLEHQIWNRQQTLWGRLRYFDVYSIINEYFANTLVLPYEVLRHDPSQFISKLNDHFGKSVSVTPDVVNQAVGTAGLALRRVLNTVYPNGIGRPLLGTLPAHCAGPNRFASINLDGHEPSSVPRLRMIRAVSLVDRLLPIRSDRAKQQAYAKFASRFETEFADQNRKLADATGLDLAGFGYTGTSRYYGARADGTGPGLE